MIYPICLYGNPVLRKKALPIEQDYPGLEKIIENMWETMYNSDGVGLAAPQAGLSIDCLLWMVPILPMKNLVWKVLRRCLLIP